VPIKLETQTHSTRRFVSSLNKKNKSSWRHRCSSRARAKDLRTSAVERKPPLCRDIKSVPLCFAGPLQRQLPLLLELGNFAITPSPAATMAAPRILVGKVPRTHVILTDSIGF
jgi:hypothetical protein